MRKKRKRYSPEFKRQAVEMVRTGGKPAVQVAKDLGIPDQTLNGWVLKAEGHSPTTNFVETPEEELKRLRKDNERLRMERDFLKKAAAFFAKDENK